MKRVVFLNDLKESDIRPESTYNEYKHLLTQDIEEYFRDPKLLVDIDCPGCSKDDSKRAFSKMGFDYRLCKACGSLFISPRPANETLRSFYKNSKSGQFLKKMIIGNTMESRSKKVFSYRIQWIMGLVEEYLSNGAVFLDYATRYPVFLKQLNDCGLFKSIVSVLPECNDQENLLPRNTKIVDQVDAVIDGVDLFAAFEVMERIFDPAELLHNAFRACKKNGLFIMTSTTYSGFEYQALGEHSPNLVPLERLSLLSLEALTSRIEKAGFTIIEVSTPGRLDVEMVKKTFDKSPDIPIDSFWKYVFRHRDENALHALQDFLQQFQLSSHVRIAAIKK